MITLSNGHQLEFVASSGLLGFDGLGYYWEWPTRWLGLWDPRYFTVVLKTLTFTPRVGNLRWHNPYRVVKWLHGEGLVNSVGLTNIGFKSWLQKYAPHLRSNIKFIASITTNEIAEAMHMTRELNNLDVVGIEFNASCPNSPSEAELLNNTDLVVSLVKAVKFVSRHPVLVKLSYQQDYLAILEQLVGVVEAVEINSVSWSMVYPNTPSPLPKSFGLGGVSGKVAQKYNWAMVQKIAAQKLVPVVAPSIWEYEDIARVRDLGAKAVSFGALFVRHHPFCPSLPNQYIKHWHTEYGQF